jgi:hypothetical protein
VVNKICNGGHEVGGGTTRWISLVEEYFLLLVLKCDEKGEGGMWEGVNDPESDQMYDLSLASEV